MSYYLKYIKYKTMYLNLKGGMKRKKSDEANDANDADKKTKYSDNENERSLVDKTRQIPENFPKQRTEVPHFYKIGSEKVQRNIPIGCEKWETVCFGYNPTNYTAEIVLKHDINTPETWSEGRGWADPKAIDTPQNGKNINLYNIFGPSGMSYSERLENGVLKGATVRDEINITQALITRGATKEQLIQIASENQFKHRFSHTGPLLFDVNEYPKNPIGRTGLIGRGSLGNWGPNHAADPVVARIHNGKLQFILVRRADNSQWALPGGMVEAGQTISGTRKREFAEEAMNIEGITGNDRHNRLIEIEKQLTNIFDPTRNLNVVIYEGVVDDPRNTDQSWMETVAMLTFINNPDYPEDANLNLEAGDDANKVRWVNYNPNGNLFASHKLFIDLAVDYLQTKGYLQ